MTINLTHTLYLEANPSFRSIPADDYVTNGIKLVESFPELGAELGKRADVKVVIFGASVDLGAVLEFAAYHRVHRPSVGVVLVRDVIDLDTLQEALRAGVREVVPARDPAALTAACQRAADLSNAITTITPSVATVREPTSAKIVTVFAGKGGCGKSVVATNLAVALAANGARRVCLIDLDLQFGDVGIMLQMAPERSIADAIPMVGRLDTDGVRSLLTHYRAGVDTLLAPTTPAEGDQVTREVITELLAVARTMFDYIVVDTPSFFSYQVLSALDVTDWYVPIVVPDLPTLKSVRLTLDMFDMLQYPREKVRTLLNRSDSQVGLSHGDVEQAIGTEIDIRMPSSRDVPVSVNKGMPLVIDHPVHPVSIAIRNLADLIAGVTPAEAAPVTRRRRGLLTRKG
ncbi:AAA family ATPase [Catenuloplanes japonicus]|uniref:AAA family ATPase n=1 Tax=Catenuloplanes japonicus TaxID=33876 RepID=UPI00068D89AD|nr:P-loop NTPase [Catenuloplanes japonicus]